MTGLERWDAQWCRWYDHALTRGRTPNQAITVAWRLTEEQHGPRPEHEGANT